MEVKIPTGKGGGTTGSGAGSGDSGGSTDKGQRETNRLLKNLDKTMINNLDIIEMLTTVLNDVFKILSPLFKILSILFLVIFMPLLPLLKLLIKGFAALIKLFTGGFGNVAEMIGKMLLGLLLAVLGALLITISAPIAIVVAVLMAAFLLFGDGISAFAGWMFEKILEFGEFFVELFTGLRELLIAIKVGIGKGIIEIVKWLMELPAKLWAGIQTAWNWLGVKIKSLWEIIRKPFDFLGRMFKNVLNGIINLVNKVPGINIPQLANGGIVNSPTIAMIGEAGPEAVIPLSKMGNMGGTTININSPTVRDDRDIKKLADDVSRELQRDARTRFS